MLSLASKLDSVVTEDFLPSAPKTSKRTRRPRPKHKTTPTSEVPQTKLGKCGFLVKGVNPSSSWKSGIDASGGNDSPREPSEGGGTKWSVLIPLLSLQRRTWFGETGAAEFHVFSAYRSSIFF